MTVIFFFTTGFFCLSERSSFWMKCRCFSSRHCSVCGDGDGTSLRWLNPHQAHYAPLSSCAAPCRPVQEVPAVMVAGPSRVPLVLPSPDSSSSPESLRRPLVNGPPLYRLTPLPRRVASHFCHRSLRSRHSPFAQPPMAPTSRGAAAVRHLRRMPSTPPARQVSPSCRPNTHPLSAT